MSLSVSAPNDFDASHSRVATDGVFSVQGGPIGPKFLCQQLAKVGQHGVEHDGETDISDSHPLNQLGKILWFGRCLHQPGQPSQQRLQLLRFRRGHVQVLSQLQSQRSIRRARHALDGIRLIDNVPARPAALPPRANGEKLEEALAAIKAAAEAVRNGEYGRAPVEGARSTRAYRLWSELYRAVEGDERSLLRALQEKGFVKVRKG